MNTPVEILAAFDLASRQLSQLRYAERHARLKDGLMTEAQIRLGQAEFFLRQFHQREHESDDWTQQSATVGLVDELKAYGEAFYYFASRAHKAMASVRTFNLRFEPEGVRCVRNHMVEHPDRKGGLLVNWWQTGCPEGLVLSPGSTVGRKRWIDPGLYPNASEFIERLGSKLKTALDLGRQNGWLRE